MTKRTLALVEPLAVEPVTPDGFDLIVAEWLDHLRAENKAANTIATYGYAAQSLRVFMHGKRWSLDPAEITRKRLEAWVRELLVTRSDATANNYFRGLRSLFAWLHAEGEIDENPMAAMKPPTIGEKVVPVVTTDQLRALVATCADSREYRDVRDLAILRLFIECGVRLAELTNVALDDVDKAAKRITVTGKGNKQRVVSYGPKAAVALNRYLRLRARHARAGDSALWLGTRGPMTRSGLYQVARARAKQAGFVVHPHQFRHTFAHEWKMAGGSDSDLMAFCGWSAPSMVLRYGKSAASERAHYAFERLGMGERV